MIRNLGVYFDSELTMQSHITKVIQCCNFHLKSISKIRLMLDTETTKLLVCSLILSRIDYCNALLAGCPNYVIDRLQKIQNKAARLVTLTKTREHITPVLCSLHWLPVKYRIDFKILCYAFKCLNNLSPVYLNELVEMYQPCRTLRSSSALLMKECMHSSNFSLKAFQNIAPSLWNPLSTKCKTSSNFYAFRKCLKTELFSRAFSDL